MSDYTRVIPRDLFNESALLRDLGRLAILLGETRGHNAGFVQENVERFDIGQDPASGNIRVKTLDFVINGENYLLERPLNSREPYALMIMLMGDPDYNLISVFDDEGNFSEEMKELLGV